MPTASRRKRAAHGLALVVLAAGSAHAGRPLATDDTSVAPGGECQVEVWSEREDDLRSVVVAPACGLTDTLELDTGFARVQGGGRSLDAFAAGLKWVPAEAVWESPLGEVRVGLLGGASWSRATQGGWRGDNAVLAGLSSLQFAPEWSIYANAIVARGLNPQRWLPAARAALAWQAEERLLLFVEGLWARESKPVGNAGFRIWALPEVLGLDFVVTRTGSDTVFGVGIGWYGIFGRSD
jgi:hypothetical protein